MHSCYSRADRSHLFYSYLLCNAYAQITNFDDSIDMIEYIVSIDDDDDQIECYKQWCIPNGIILISNKNRSLVDACNNAAKIATGDCFLVLSDDFLTPPLFASKQCRYH